jgi:Lon protease-like protein
MLLPLFPLQLVVFPGEEVKLHIFEPRYKELINECRENQSTFGVPAYLDGRLADYGTELSLEKTFKTYPGGEMDVLTSGRRVFELKAFVRDVPDRLYSGGEVTLIENAPEEFGITVEELAHQFAVFHQLLGTGHTLENAEGPNLSFRIGHAIGLNLAQKVQLLSMQKESDRQLFILDHLNRMNKTLQAADETKRRVRGNGHFTKPPKLDL